ncbi:DUF2779 domain-containing protein [Mycoplasma zalophidermidis]|uniref:DUF2779 domain-containing protein n=1 Tax=Mycoplasma zalophidermidis TaxID=398174 RepID=UPI00215D0AEB|nr:DUF2779 domain-containing protein [Mycoplasma zalophidermidis]MCR8966649.1 DUF2779 domain-containing protein [Mycoplasma zalophidermidis]
MKISSSDKLNKDNTKLISFSQFKTYYTSQPYFIWSEKDSEGNSIIPNVDINGFKLFLDSMIESSSTNEALHQFDFLKELNDEDEESYYDNKYLSDMTKSFFTSEWNYKMENQNMFTNAYKQACDYLIKYHGNNLTTSYMQRIFPVTQLHLADEFLNDFLVDNNKTLLIDPTFCYLAKKSDANFVVKATCFAYCKEHCTLYFQKMKSSTNIDDYLKAYFTYNVALKSRIKINNIKFVIFDFENDKKGRITFRTVDGSYSSASASSVKREGISLTKEANKLIVRDLINSGLAHSQSNYEGLKASVYNSFKLGYVFDNPKSKDVTKFSTKIVNNIRNNELFIPDLTVNLKEAKYEEFDQSISKIIDASKITKPAYSIKQNGELIFDLSTDSTAWGKNKELNTIKNLYLGPNYVYSSGNGGTGNSLKILDQNHIDKHKFIVDKLYSFPNYFTNKALELISELMVKNLKIVWYDYEGVSSLIPIFDGLKSWRQVPHQVSVIITQNGQVVSEEDVIKDPKNLELIDLVDVIIRVHSSADKYVVFNKNYENTRNLEIRDMVKQRYDNFDQNNTDDVEFVNQMRTRGFDSWLDFEILVKHIYDNTFDLLECFTTKTDITDQVFYVSRYIKYNEYHKPSFKLNLKEFEGNLDDYKKICDEYRRNTFADKELKTIRIMELLGYTSIKKLEKLITKSGYQYRWKIKEYAGLEIKNGSMALELAVNRNANCTKDNEWAAKVEKLKEYCHNDVVAMIVVYEFILGFIADVFPEIYGFEFELNKNEKLAVDFDSKKLIKVAIK